eukprot:10283549-Alexandrium_andersonii.AAC.1
MHSPAAVAGRDTVRNTLEHLCSSAQAVFERARHGLRPPLPHQQAAQLSAPRGQGWLGLAG